MKKYLKNMHDKTNFWNLFIGIIIGFGVGVYALNALIPNATESIRMYHMDRESREREMNMRHGGFRTVGTTATTSVEIGR
jgi:hypothetical protein